MRDRIACSRPRLPPRPAKARPAVATPCACARTRTTCPSPTTRKQGFENRIAELLGKHLGVPVTYFNYPQRFVFIRNTLRYKLPGEDYPCDVIIGVPVGFDQVAVTKPYYRSTYAMVFAQGKGLDDVNSVNDFLALGPERLRNSRIGLYHKSPASQWMDRHNLVDQGVPYQTINVAMDHYVGDIIDKDLAGGKLDVAIVWGPVAGYYASKFNPPMKVVPMKSEPGVQFDFAFGMGIRRGEPEVEGATRGLPRHPPGADRRNPEDLQRAAGRG